MEAYLTELIHKIAAAEKAKKLSDKANDDVFDYLRSLTDKEKIAARAHKEINVSLRFMTRGK